jgi:TonB-linked SusC/RagA family outer membrane protein
MRSLKSAQLWTFALLAVGVLGSSSSALAQATGQVTGAVTGDGGRPISGASVSIAGTTRGEQTDAAGRYTITGVPAGAQTVRVTAAGYAEATASVTVVAGQTATANITLTQQAVQLEEVVAVGYGTARRRDVTGAVGSVNVEDVPTNVTSNVGQMIQGRVAGAQVVQNNGAPGGGISIRVRGTNSITANSEPLYVVDGVPAVTGTSSQDPYQNPLSAINPTDIENIEILKDASSTAIYGARGAAGVVLITTKRGRRGENRVTIESSYGTQTAARKISMLNAQQFATLVNEANTVADKSLPYTQAQIDAMGAGTNWEDEVLRTAPQQSHTLTFSGGDETTRYVVSGSFFDQEGIVRGSDFKRYSGRVNLDRNIGSKLNIGTNLTVSNTDNNIQPSDESLGNSTVMGALWFNPVSPIRNPDGTYVQNSPVTWPVENPVANADEIFQRRSIFAAIGNVYGEYSLLDNLRVRSTVGITSNFERYRYYAPRTIARGSGSNGTGNEYAGQSFNVVNENTVNYNRELFGNSLDVLGGFTVQTNRFESNSSSNSQFVNDLLGVYGLGSGTRAGASSDYTDWALLSWLGRANYNLQDKYLFTLTGRADGSSRFGENNKWGFFPSAAFAWRAIDEGFMQNQSLFSDLKVRLSYGVTGNQEIGLYNSLARLSTNTYTFGGVGVVGFNTAGAAPNPNLKWETTRQYNAGLDMGWFDNRITASVDAYHSTTDDLLLSVGLPVTTGFTSQLQNIGSVENNGVELALNTLNVERDRFSWRSTLNAAANRNKVTDLGVANEIAGPDKGIGGQTGAGNTVLIRVGEPLGVFQGLPTNGIFQEGDPCYLTGDDVVLRSTLDCVPGEYRYVDTNGDGKITSADRVLLGSAQPDWYGGLTNDFTYGPVNVNVFLQGSFGNEVLNAPAINIRNVNTFSNQTADALDRWTPTNTDTDIPRANANRPREIYDVHVEDGSYIRLQSVTVGYTVPENLIPGTNNARIFLTGQNLHVWTKYKGFDPESNSFGGNAASRGIDLGAYPRARTWNLGVNLSF